MSFFPGTFDDMKHSLQLKLSQHLTLTPQLQQSIRLLQLSTVELNQELERYLAENPLLERSDLVPEGEAEAAPPQDGGPRAEAEPAPAEERPAEHSDERPDSGDDMPMHGGDEGSGSSRRDDDREDFTQFAAAEPTLHDHLTHQLSLTSLTERDKRVAALIIGSLDEDGYLKPSLEELRETARGEIGRASCRERV